MAYSSGFSPHPRVSWVGAAPTGAASEAEYVEIGLVRECHPAAVRAALDRALPPGLDVLDCEQAAGGSLPDRITGSAWRIQLPGLDPAVVAAAVASFLAADSAPVERRVKDAMRTVDARAAVVTARVVGRADEAGGTPVETAGASVRGVGGRGENTPAGRTTRPGGQVDESEDRGGGHTCAILDVVVRHTTPAVRPDDVLAALRAQADLTPLSPHLATRTAQGLLAADGVLADPLAPDRVAAPRPADLVGD
jgi:hypothetical protein